MKKIILCILLNAIPLLSICQTTVYSIQKYTVTPYNDLGLSNLGKALQYKSNTITRHQILIQDRINEVGNYIITKIHQEGCNEAEISKPFNSYVNALPKKAFDISNPAHVNAVLNQLNTIENGVRLFNCKKVEKPTSTYSENISETKYFKGKVLVREYSHLLKKPETGSEIVGTVKGEIVTILNRVGEDFYIVKANEGTKDEKVAYLWKGWILHQLY